MSQEPNQPRHPDICVQLTGEDGNAFAILGRTTRALRQAGLAQARSTSITPRPPAATTTICCKPPWPGSTGSSHPQPSHQPQLGVLTWGHP
jgi:hypothetical protein